MINIIIIGKSQVGKTSIIKRYVDSKFQELTKPTFGMTFATKHLSLADDENDCKL